VVLKDGDIVVSTKSVKLYSSDLLDGKIVGVYRESNTLPFVSVPTPKGNLAFYGSNIRLATDAEALAFRLGVRSAIKN
jgi:hypothetical protein